MTLFSFPIREPYRVTQWFGQNLLDYSSLGLKAHNGIDIACNRGTPVFAPADGLIVWITIGSMSGDKKAIGNSVALHISKSESNKFYEHVFGHLLTVNVMVGQRVTRGSLLGTVDTTGFSTRS